MLELKNITFSYGRHCILKDVNLTVEDGEKIAILGPSGYGKSTLAKIMAGYLAPDKGQVLWNNANLPKSSYCPVQLVYQHPEKFLNPRRKMIESLCEAGTPEKEVLEGLGIRSLWYERWPNELSGGELQRFCVARITRPETRLIIADEMTTMLDALNQAHIWGFLLKYAEKHNISIVSITHNPILAKRVSDRIINIPDLNHIKVDRESI